MKSSQRKPAPDEAEVLRRLIHESHECIQDLKALIREARETAVALEEAGKVGVNARLEEAIKEGLEEYKGSVTKAIDNATAAVFERFDTIYDTLTGVTKAEKRAGKRSLDDLVDEAQEKLAKES